jgi:hypothetical protein
MNTWSKESSRFSPEDLKRIEKTGPTDLDCHHMTLEWLEDLTQAEGWEIMTRVGSILEYPTYPQQSLVLRTPEGDDLISPAGVQLYMALVGPGVKGEREMRVSEYIADTLNAKRKL